MNNTEHTFTAAHSRILTPGTEVTSEGIRFTAAICRGSRLSSIKLILFFLPECTREEYILSDDYAVGNMYSVMIQGLKPGKLAYCYEIDGRLYNDPFASRLLSVSVEGYEVKMSAVSELTAKDTTYPLPHVRTYPERVSYLLNVRGFTMDKGAGVPSSNKGTFQGTVKKIPYLKTLGITTVVLMPVTELTPERTGRERMLPSLFDLGIPSENQKDIPASSCVKNGTVKENSEKKGNYWRFGSSYYFAPAAILAKNGLHPEKEYLEMIRAFHDAGIEVVQQLWFSNMMAGDIVRNIAVYYVTRYGLDGLQLIGSNLPLQQLTKDPVLSNTMLWSTHFPYENAIDFHDDYILHSPSAPVRGRTLTGRSVLADCNDDYLYLVRRFVKGDDLVINDFIHAFLGVSTDHGNIHYAATYNGFTLKDTVTYSCKHNEANGEDNRDGTDNNASWNCGQEGPSKRRDIVKLRRSMIRNLLTLVMLSEGTPLLYAGDECGNSQGGNNNPYCQDNEIGWTNWKDNRENRDLLQFVRKLISFRKEHSVFCKETPFRFSDYRSYGFPDVSFHGQDAWKADLSGYSHTVGILYCEDYEKNLSEASLRGSGRDLLYIGMNMFWQQIEFGLPTLPSGYGWFRIMDTSFDEPFLAEPIREAEIKCTAAERSILILKSLPIPEKVPEDVSAVTEEKDTDEKEDH